MIRPVLILLLGSAAAQAGPLLFAPLLSRAVSPEVFGHFHLAMAVAANVAVVACARYEFALPLAADEVEAARLRELCRRILMAVTALTALAGAVAAGVVGVLWPLALAPMVGALGALSLWTMEATRHQRVQALAVSRVLQHWGCGVWQWVGVLAVGALWAGGAASGGVGAGASGQPLASSWLETLTLAVMLSGPFVAAGAAAMSLRRAVGPSTVVGLPWADLRQTAQRHRDFPLLNTPHAFLGAVQDTASLALIAAWAGPATAGVWAVALRLLKAPATLVGGSVSQVLYPRLAAHGDALDAARRELRPVLLVLLATGAALALLLGWTGSWLLPTVLGEGWDASGPLTQALAVYIGLHFVASPLAVVTLAWQAQGWALKVSLVGQVVFLGSLSLGLVWGGSIEHAAWSVSAAMAAYFAWYVWRLSHGPVPRDRSAAPRAGVVG